MNIQAIIFDMDGVLIDSEPFWQQAELQVFHQLGLKVTRKDTEQTTGLRIDELVSYWYQRQPWDNYDNAQVSHAIVEQVVQQITDNGRALPGVQAALRHCQQLGLKIGLATSSSTHVLDAVLAKLNIRQYFDALQSAEALDYGKPHPEVYLKCAAQLKVNPTDCVAVEDSFNGLIAARAANMHTVVIPDPSHAKDTKWQVAHQQLDSLNQLSAYLNQLTVEPK